MQLATGSGDLSRQVMQYHDLAQSKPQAGVGSALIVAELNFYCVPCQEFDHGANLPSTKASIWEILCQTHDIEQLNSGIHISLRFH